MNKPLIISNYQGLNQRYLYSERDLNPHNRYGHKILSLACLPFHHPSRSIVLLTISPHSIVRNGMHRQPSERRDSNPRPRPWQGRALPTELLSQYINDQYLFESLLHCDLAKVGFTSLFGARSNRCHSPTRPSRGLFIFWDCKCKYVYPFFKVFTQISKSEDAINKQNQFIIR